MADLTSADIQDEANLKINKNGLKSINKYTTL